MEELLALGRYTFLLEVQSICDVTMDFVDLVAAQKSSPSRSGIEIWVGELAVLQNLIASVLIETAPVFLQSDGGQKGQEVKLINIYDKEKGEILTFWLSLASAGKKSDLVAQGAKKAMERFGLEPVPAFHGFTGDSGCGTVDSMLAALATIQMIIGDGIAVSCAAGNEF
jgi:hypothetical protein